MEKSAQIIQETSHIEFEAYFPPQLNLENAKDSLDVEGPHHNNIFSGSVDQIVGNGSGDNSVFSGENSDNSDEISHFISLASFLLAHCQWGSQTDPPGSGRIPDGLG